MHVLNLVSPFLATVFLHNGINFVGQFFNSGVRGVLLSDFITFFSEKCGSVEKFGRISGIRPAGILLFLPINRMRHMFFSPTFALVGGESVQNSRSERAVNLSQLALLKFTNVLFCDVMKSGFFETVVKVVRVKRRLHLPGG